MSQNSFGAASSLRVGDTDYQYFRLAALEETGVRNISRMPFSTRILLENLLRHEDGRRVTAADIDFVARGAAGSGRPKRSASCRRACCCRTSPGSPRWWTWRPCATPWRPWAPTPIAPTRCCRPTWSSTTPCRWTAYGSSDAFQVNALLEFQRNRERYILLRWGQTAFQQLPRGAAGHRHRAPGQPGIPGAGGVPRRTAWLTPIRWWARTPTPP